MWLEVCTGFLVGAVDGVVRRDPCGLDLGDGSNSNSMRSIGADKVVGLSAGTAIKSCFLGSISVLILSKCLSQPRPITLCGALPLPLLLVKSAAAGPAVRQQLLLSHRCPTTQLRPGRAAA